MGLFSKKKKKKTREIYNENMLLTDDSSFVIQEAYKALRTNIIFSTPANKSKILAVTSSNRGEGKSTNTINMAISFGQLGKKVLLIDGDMRLPTLGSKLDIKAVPGLSDVLIGNSAVEDAICTIEKLYIDVLPAGTIPPDPTELLASETMKELLLSLREKYDYIFIDSPPVTTVTDVAILSRQIDGYLLIVKNNSSEYHDVSEMLEHLRLVNGKILGFVFVGAEASSKKYYKYGE